MITVRLPHGATLATATERLGLSEDDVDTGYGLVLVDPGQGLYGLRVTDEAARDVFDEISRRIQAIALVHQSLYEQQSAANIDMHAYLAKLAEFGANVYGSDERGIAIGVRANGRLDLDKAVSVGVIASEVLANALKHAFPDGRTGRVDVEFSRGQGECVLCVRDDGVGMPDDYRPGTGMGIVNALITQLEAQVAIRREGGTVFEIRFAVPDAAA